MDLLRFITLRRLGKALYGIVVAAILAEVGLALFYRQEEALQRDLIQRDPRLGFRVVPHYDGTLGKTGIPLKTNSWGFRDREYGDPPANGVRVLVLGDSMVFGQGIHAEETFPRFLEPMLAERWKVPVEVVNGGVPGYGTTQEAALLEQLIDVVKPDLVLMAVTVFNDISDNLKFGEQLHRWQEKRSRARQLRTFLRHNSQIYVLLRRYRAGVSGRQMMDIHAIRPSSRTAKGVELIEQGLDRARQTATARGAAFAVMINPGQIQATDRAWREAIAKYQVKPDAYAFDLPNRTLRQFLAGRGIAVLDLLDTFRAHPDDDFYHSEHWLRPGQQLVASSIADFLDAQGLLRQALARKAEGTGRTPQVAPPSAGDAGVNGGG